MRSHLETRRRVKGQEVIDDFGYGTGYTHAVDQWQQLPGFEMLRRKGIGIVMLAQKS